MAVVYLRHPVHGELVESNEMMVAIHKTNGWEEFDPVVAPVEPPAPKPEVPSFLVVEDVPVPKPLPKKASKG